MNLIDFYEVAATNISSDDKVTDAFEALSPCEKEAVITGQLDSTIVNVTQPNNAILHVIDLAS